MASNWQPGTQYNLDSVVMYNDVQYKIIQPHRSQGDWTPDVTPALWCKYVTGDDGQARHWDEHHDITSQEKKTGWNNLSPGRRQAIEAGGGLLLLAGGFLAWEHHTAQQGINAEQKKETAWGLQNWITEAQAHTENFHRNGPSGQATWVLSHGNQIPEGAFIGGKDIDDTPLYVIRTYFEGGIQPGKLSRNFTSGGMIGYDSKEHAVDVYEILLAGDSNVRWVRAFHPFKVQDVNGTPVDGGREADGTQLFIAQAEYKDGVHPGKISEKLGVAHITFGGHEQTVNTFNVLVYA